MLLLSMNRRISFIQNSNQTMTACILQAVFYLVFLYVIPSIARNLLKCNIKFNIQIK